MANSAKRLRIAGTVVLFAGLIAAASIYLAARPDERTAILGVDIRTNKDRMQLERMGGKSYVLMKDFDEWFTTLWHGRRLGCTIGVLSILGFLVCRGLAFAEEDFPQSSKTGNHGNGPNA